MVPTSLPALFQAGGMTQDPVTHQWSGPFGPINPVSQSIFSMYPLAQSSSQCPNVNNTLLLQGTGLYCSHDLQVGNEDYVLGRVDYTLGSKDSLFARYTRESAYQILPYVYTQVPGFPELDHERNQYLTLEERHTFSPKILNEARLGLVRIFTQTGNGGVTGTGTALHAGGGRQDMDFSPGQGLANLGPSPSSPSRPVTNRFSVGDSVIMSLGAHSLRFGATMTRVQLNQVWDQYSGGAWIFANLAGLFGPGLGGSLYGNPLLCVCGAGSGYSYTTPDGKSYPFSPNRYWRQTWLSPFIQDDWKISSRLTLNLGVRYEWASNPTTVGTPVFVINNLTSPTTTENSFVAAKHPFTSNPNAKNIDPRIGLAWDVFGDHKTSIRAGFGMFHEPVTARTYATDNTSFLPNDPLFFLFFSTGLFPKQPTSPHQLIGGLPANSQIAWYYAIQQNVDTAPYIMQYNLNIQRELGAGTVLTVGYNGSAGVHLFMWADANAPLGFSDLNAAQRATALATGNYPTATGQGARGTVANPFMNMHVNPNFQAVEATIPGAHSSYHSLQASLNRQFSRTLSFNASYTWSKCLDDASATISTEQGEWAVVNAYNPGLDKGPCSFSSNQVFTANGIYRLPFKGNRAVDGWQISPIVNRFTGLPFNVQTMFGGQYQSQTGGATEGERPQRVPGCNPMTKKRSQWWNPECYVFAPFGTLGNAGRDSLNNPNYFNLDFSLMKDTKLTEKVTMQFRAEFFDILNHPNFNVGNQVYLMSTANTVTPSVEDPVTHVVSPNPNYSQISNPAAYRNPTATSPGGVICNPSQQIGAPVTGPCYLPGTALSATMPGSMGGQRQIQFALKFIF